MQFVNFSPPSNVIDHQDVITHAILRDDGRVRFEVNGQLLGVLEDRPGIVQIALAESGLWCHDSRGQVFHLQGKPTHCEWVQVDSLSNITSIGTLSDGRICVVTSQGKAIVRTESEDSSETEWQFDTEVANTLGVMKKQPVRNYQRFGIRSLLLLFVLFALVLGPYAAYRQTKLQEKTIGVLELQGCKISYAHEFDEDGKRISDPVEPGAEWLKKILGRHWFLTPVGLVASGGQSAPVFFDQIGNLPTLQELRINGRGLKDLEFLDRIRSLKRLHLSNQKFEPEKLAPIRRHTKLEKLSLDDRNGLSVVKDLLALKSLSTYSELTPEMADQLQGLTHLTELRLRGLECPDVSVLSGLVNLEILEIASVVESLEPLRNLRQLKSLTLNVQGFEFRGLDPLSGLTNLESLRLKDGKIHDLSWAASLTNLEELNIQNSECDDHSPLLNLTKLKSLGLGNGSPFEFSILDSIQLTIEDVRRGSSGIWRTYGMGSMSGPSKVTLSIPNCQIRNLEFVRKSPRLVAAVNLSNNQITDVEPISGFTLATFCNLNGNPISDISPLLKWPDLKRLWLAGTLVDDTSGIAKFTKLTSVDLANTGVTNIDGFEAMKGLDSLTIDNTSVIDLEPIRNSTKLSTFSCANTPVEKFALNKNRMLTLDLSNTQVSDLTEVPIVLKRLNLSGSKVTDISRVLEFHELEHLALADLSVDDVTRIGRLTNLRSLDLSGTKVRDVSELRYLSNLRKLSLANTEVADISGLKYCRRLSDLDLSNTQVTDFSPLAKLECLNRVNVSSNRFVDWQDLPRFGVKKRGFGFGSEEFSTRVVDVSATQIVDMTNIPVDIFKLKLNCEHANDLFPLKTLKGLGYLELTGFKVTHGLSWLNLRSLTELSLEGEAITDPAMLNWLSKAKALTRLRLPAGSVFEAAWVEQLYTLESVHVGEERVWYWKDNVGNGDRRP